MKKVWPYLVCGLFIASGVMTAFSDKAILAGIGFVLAGVSFLPQLYESLKGNKNYKAARIIVPIILMAFTGAMLPEKQKSNSAAESLPKQENEVVEQQEKELTVEERIAKTWEDISKDDVSNTEVISIAGTKEYRLSTDYNGGAWDETDLVNTLFSRYVRLCLDTYDNEDIDMLSVSVRAPMTDSKGNENMEYVFKIGMKKEVFKTYNWKNLESTNLDFDMVSNDCDYFDLHAGIWQGFKKSRFIYFSYK